MKKGILITIVVGMLGWAMYDLVNSNDTIVEQGEGTISEVHESEEVGLSRGGIAPDFELETLEGETVRLSDYRGQRVLVNFWATWCPPCRAEMPDMQKLYNYEDVEILAVNMTDTESSESTVTEFVDDLDLTFPVLMDVDAEVVTNYQVRAYPTSYMIDSNGRIQFIAMGAMNYDLMVQELEKMD
ncbi:peroxiredoxin family protein [Aquibacillus saliphilus]|uniref:peroxiredoxin family protein n=1 Tax=Aquibacillus saliphilus TaxID=1909422 RepID=UPI001CF03996|nr:redoxin domain-containing protein [Aquibacillus saliphilus]